MPARAPAVHILRSAFLLVAGGFAFGRGGAFGAFRRRGRGGRGCFFRLAAGDGRDGEVAVADGGAGALGQRDLRDVDGVADVEAGEVDDDLFRNLVGLALQADSVAHDVERAAALDARRSVVILEVHDD